MTEYAHPEAFCHMMYRCETCGRGELIWNSRDGVTPFIISCLVCGGSAEHVNWRMDRRDEGYKPAKGERIFTNLTEERARTIYKAFRAADRLPNTLTFQRYWAELNSHGEPAPDLVVVE